MQFLISKEVDQFPPCFQVEGNYVYTSGEDGLIKVHELRGTELHTVFESEDVKGSRGASIQYRPVQSLAVHSKVAYYGDDGTNVKALDWLQGWSLS